jgi:DNA-binding HxlR family transcriptional regulator
MQRKSMESASCPVARSLDVVGEWWSLLILRDAFAGTTRFTEFQRSLGLARNVLSARLRKLVAYGVLDVAPASDGSAYQEYVLTERGKALSPVLVALRQWGEHHLFRPDEPQATLVDKAFHQPLRLLDLRANDGRLLQPEEIELLPAKKPGVNKPGLHRLHRGYERRTDRVPADH